MVTLLEIQQQLEFQSVSRRSDQADHPIAAGAGSFGKPDMMKSNYHGGDRDGDQNHAAADSCRKIDRSVAEGGNQSDQQGDKNKQVAPTGALDQVVP